MTEEEWLSCTDPTKMMHYFYWSKHRTSDRKLRLFACARVRPFLGLLTDERSKNVVIVAERFADGEATYDELNAACNAAHTAASEAWVPPRWAWAVVWVAQHHASFAASMDITPSQDTESSRAALRAEQADVLRDIIDNPFCPEGIKDEWKTADVLSVAHSIYTERLPDGRLDNTRLLVLSDALEEAGCTSNKVLATLRSKRPKYRGFWPLDLVLGLY